MIIKCPRPNCAECIHWRCDRSEDEVNLCAILLEAGIDFSKQVAPEDREEENENTTRFRPRHDSTTLN